MDLCVVEVMDRFENVMEFYQFDLCNVIQQSHTLAHTDHYDQLRLRNHRFVELMYAPRPRQGSDVSLVGNVSSEQTSARSGMYNEDVEEESQHVKDAYEDEMEEGENREEQEIVRTEESEGDKPTAQDVARDAFDDDMEALQDEIKREDRFMKVIDSITNTIESVPANHHLPKDDAMVILDRLHELNINVDFVKVLQKSNIGILINRMSRKHPDRAVKDKAHMVVSAWKALVTELYARRLARKFSKQKRRQLAKAASSPDESGPVSEEELGLPFSESDIPVATGASSASERPFGVNHSGRISGSSPDNEQHVGLKRQGVARVIKVDKCRPIQVRGKPSLDELDANPSGSIKKGQKAPSESGPSQLRTNTATTSAPVRKHGLAPRPRQMVEGSEMEYQGTTGNAGFRKPDALPKPNVGAVRPRVETVIKIGLATKALPLPRDVNAEPVPTDIHAAILRSKRKLREGYEKIANAKKSRTVRCLQLTELPKGGRKAQRPGHRSIRA